MARKARKTIIPATHACELHLTSRLVRRMHLFGGARGDKRKQQLHDCLVHLIDIFPMQSGGYTFMDNHVHLMIQWDPTLVDSWSCEDLARRFFKLHPIKDRLTRKPLAEPPANWLQNKLADADFLLHARAVFKEVGEFMKAWKGPLAQRWNKEDGVTGHFWAERYKSHRIFGALHRATVMTTQRRCRLEPTR